MGKVNEAPAMQKPFELPDVENWRSPEAVRAQMAYRNLVEKALSEAPIDSVPDGWRLVPVEPTRQMMSQGHFALGETDRGKFRRIYQAMLAAAPEVTSGTTD